MYMCVYVWVCAFAHDSQERAGIPWSWSYRQSCEPSDVDSENLTQVLQQSSKCWAAEPGLQPLVAHLKTVKVHGTMTH